MRGGRGSSGGTLRSSSSTVETAHDRVGLGLELLLVLLVLLLGSLGRGIEPRNSLVDGRLERRLVITLPLVGELVILKGVAEV